MTAPPSRTARVPNATRSAGAARGADFVGVVLVALAVRLLVCYQLREHVLFHTLVSDGAAYDAWAARIAAGDWLGKDVFYQAPLYPYFLAIVQRLVGDDLGRIRSVQALIGALSCGVLLLAAARLVGRAAGLAAGLLLALYPPAIFSDLIIQKTVLDSLFLACVLWTLATAQEWSVASMRASCLPWAAGGAALGALVLTRENALLLLPALAAWALWRLRQAARSRRLTAVASFLGGTAVLLAPVGLRNWIVGGEFALTTAQLGPNFYIGNNTEAPGVYVPLRPNRSDPLNERKDATELAQAALGRELTPAEVSHYWLGRSWEFIRNRPAAWLRLLGVKLMLALNAYEIPDAEDQYFFERTSSVLRGLGRVFHFGVLLPVAAAGLVLAGRPRDMALLYVVIATLLAGVALFYVFGRYRFTLVPPLMPLAGAAASRCVAAFQRARGGTSLRRWLIAAGAATLAACVANPRFVYAAGGLTPTWFGSARPALHRDAQLAVSLANAGHALARQGRLPEALDSYAAAIAAQPRFAGAHYQRAVVLLRIDRPAEAADALTTALRLDPQSCLSHLTLASAFAALGDRPAAERHLRTGLALTPIEAAGWNRAGVTEVSLGERSVGVDHLRRAVRELPDNAAFRIDLAEALAVDSRTAAEAIEYLDPVLHPPPPPPGGVRRSRDGRRFAPGEVESWASEPRAWLALARAMDASGRNGDAASAAERGLALARSADRTEQRRIATELLRSYRNRASPTSDRATP